MGTVFLLFYWSFISTVHHHDTPQQHSLRTTTMYHAVVDAPHKLPTLTQRKSENRFLVKRYEPVAPILQPKVVEEEAAVDYSDTNELLSHAELSRLKEGAWLKRVRRSGSAVKPKYGSKSFRDMSKGGNDIITTAAKCDNRPHIKVTPEDLEEWGQDVLFSRDHKVVMCTIPGVSQHEWKSFMSRLNRRNVHHPSSDVSSFAMSSLTAEEATSIMNDPSWHRVAFIRDPALRLLSAFLELMRPYEEQVNSLTGELWYKGWMDGLGGWERIKWWWWWW